MNNKKYLNVALLLISISLVGCGEDTSLPKKGTTNYDLKECVKNLSNKMTDLEKKGYHIRMSDMPIGFNREYEVNRARADYYYDLQDRRMLANKYMEWIHLSDNEKIKLGSWPGCDIRKFQLDYENSLSYVDKQEIEYKKNKEQEADMEKRYGKLQKGNELNSGAGSLVFCESLANIGGNTIKARNSGHSLRKIIDAAQSALADSPQHLSYATGTVTAVYGDRSLRSYDQGYNVVFQSCMKK